MPDVKHCGGVGEAVRSGRSAIGKGHGFSIHSPAGPISLLGSGHATAAVSGAMRLEHAVYEADWRADLVLPTERVEDGRLWFPGGVGSWGDAELGYSAAVWAGVGGVRLMVSVWVREREYQPCRHRGIIPGCRDSIFS